MADDQQPQASQPNPQALAAAPAALFPQSPDLTQTVQQQSQLGQKAFGEQHQALMDINRQLTGAPGQPGLIEQQQQQAGQLSFHPNFGGGFLHNLGQALLAIGASTRPGQAVQSTIYSKPREEYAGRAEQIGALQKQEQELAGGLAPAAQLAYKPFQAQAAERRAGAEEVKAGAAVMNAQNRALHDRTMESLRSQFQDLQKQIAAGKLTAENARTQAMILIGRGHDQAIQSVAATSADQRDRDTQVKAFEDEYKISTDNMIKQWFGGLVGITPEKPSAKPTAPAGPKAAGSKPTPKASAASTTPKITEGATATGPGGHKIKFTGGKWVDAATGKPIS